MPVPDPEAPAAAPAPPAAPARPGLVEQLREREQNLKNPLGESPDVKSSTGLDDKH